MTCIECKVIVKDEGKKLVTEYLLYDPLTIALEDVNIRRMISETMDQFKVEDCNEKPSIVIKTTTVIQ